jgi:hypothetical protein
MRKKITEGQRYKNITNSLYQIGVTLMCMLLLKEVTQGDLNNLPTYLTHFYRLSSKIK